MIVLLGVYLVIGGITIYHVHHFYNSPFVPNQIKMQAIYPYELFEGLCAIATIYCVVMLFKKKYPVGVYVGFAAIVLCGLFFAIHK